MPFFQRAKAATTYEKRDRGLALINTNKEILFRSTPALELPEQGEVTLGPNETRVALARFDLLREYRKYVHEQKALGKKTLEAKNEFVKIYSAGLFQNLLNILGVVSNFKTLDRWQDVLDANGRNYQALAPGYSVVRNTILSDAEQQAFIRAMCNPNQLNYSEAYRLVCKTFEQQGHSVTASQDAFEYWFKNKWLPYNNDVYTYSRFGEKAYNDTVAPHVHRDYDKIEVGDTIVADGHTLNFEMLNPFGGKPKRMTLILFYDFKSGMPLGFEFMPSENTMAISAALRKSIILLGFKPRRVYIDNGKAFRSKFFRGTDLSTCGLDGLYNRLGIECHFAKPYHGQSKPLERFFGTLGEFERMQIAYTGLSIETKPARMMRNEKLHKRMFDRNSKQYMDIYEAQDAIRDWFQEYANRKHVDGFYKGITPIEVYNTSLERVKSSPDFDSRTIDPEALYILMLDAHITKIYKDGIRFKNTKYYSPELHGYNGSALIRYDITDKRSIYVFTDDGTFICKAQAVNFIDPFAVKGSEDHKLLVGELRLQKTLKKATENKVLEIAGVPAAMRLPAETLPAPSEKPLAVLQADIQAEEELLKPKQSEPDFSMFAPPEKSENLKLVALESDEEEIAETA